MSLFGIEAISTNLWRGEEDRGGEERVRAGGRWRDSGRRGRRIHKYMEHKCK